MKINSWESLPFQKYVELNKIKTDDDFQKLIEMVAVLNDLSINEVKEMKAKNFQSFTEDITFLSQKPDFSKSNFNWSFKQLEDLTTDEFISYEKLKNDVDSMSYIISMMTGIKEEKVNQLPTTDVLYAFFLLQRELVKFINYSAKSLLQRTVKEKIRKIFSLQFFKNKR